MHAFYFSLPWRGSLYYSLCIFYVLVILSVGIHMLLIAARCVVGCWYFGSVFLSRFHSIACIWIGASDISVPRDEENGPLLVTVLRGQ